MDNKRYRMILKRTAYVIFAVLTMVLFCNAFSKAVLAADDVEYTDSDTGFKALVQDEADCLTDNEERKLLEYMKPITKYGNAYFLASKGRTGECEDIIQNAYNDNFGDPNTVTGIALLVDGDSNNLYLSGNGEFPYWLEQGTSQKILEESVTDFSEKGDYFGAEYVFTKYYEAIENSEKQRQYVVVGEDEDTTETPVETQSLKNKETGYETAIIDEADLLTDGEEKALLEDMTPFTQYGNAVFYSVNKNKGESLDVATDKFWELYGQDSDGAIFLIDMANRQISIYSDGTVYNTVTKSKAAVVVDNVYRYASKEQYYECAGEAFREMTTMLDGGK